MTIEEKRLALDNFCDKQVEAHNCKVCSFYPIENSWCDVTTTKDMTEEELDEALKLVGLLPSEPTDDPEPTYDVVTRPEHYCHGGMECIQEMVLLFGVEATKHFCLLNAWKYRTRAMYKNGEQDMDKSHQYIKFYKELCDYGEIKNL